MNRLRCRTCERVRCTQRSPRHSAVITVSAAEIKGLSAAEPGGQQTLVIPKRDAAVPKRPAGRGSGANGFPIDGDQSVPADRPQC